MWLSLIKYGVPLAVAWIIYDFGSSFVHNYQELNSKAATYENRIRLLEARDLSSKRMLERRDAAIAASKCSAQIKKWISNPDDIPQKFRPFDQLTAPNLRESNAASAPSWGYVADFFSALIK
jgi:hypothetical protein